MKREKKIVRVGIVGIVANVILVGMKILVGLVSGSVAIIVDALNNLSDSLSSVATIVCTRFANKAPDKRHPYGHGRMEYFSALVVAGMILAAGALAIRESVTKIIHPNEVNYSAATMCVVVMAIFVKLGLWFYTSKRGKQLQSQSLVASGRDALNDVLLSVATLVAAIIHILFGVGLEGWFGLGLAIFIIKAGIEMAREPLDDMLGERADARLTGRLRKFIEEYREVLGVYDLELHNYGPRKTVGSVHIQVRDNMTAAEIHALTRKISFGVFDKFDIFLTIGIYAANGRSEYKDLRKAIDEIVERRGDISSTHGFFVDEKNVYFDIVADFACAKPEQMRKEVERELGRQFKEYNFNIILDADISD